ncbi:hypothetical protein [Ramlibacter sp. PS4R-6]|uniref:hypothetical protein n=1 Tax=Ramlibacter sp. PS4R-6 TaxID=3133438 RepID=UPI0030B0F587
MKAHLKNYVTAAFLLAPAALTFTALPSTAVAQQALEVRSLEVTTDGAVAPGSRLRFRMEGTPRAEASVRVRGIRGNIALREVERGLYVGRYTVTSADRIEPGAPIRASLRNGNRVAVAEYNVPHDVRGAVAQAPAADEVRILRVNNWPAERMEPGAVLRFAVEGTPGARVWVDLPGIEQNVRLEEVRPGFYEGGYTLTRNDRLNPRAPAVAHMRIGDRASTMNIDRPLVLAAAPIEVPIEIVSHPNNGTIEGDVANVRGRTAPFARVEVRVTAVPPLLGQFTGAQQVFAQTLQADARGFFEFSFRSPLPVPGTKYDVHMLATKEDVRREANVVLYQRG